MSEDKERERERQRERKSERKSERESEREIDRERQGASDDGTEDDHQHIESMRVSLKYFILTDMHTTIQDNQTLCTSLE